MNTKFKQTEFGEIPETWDVMSINQLVAKGVLEKPLDGNHGGIHPKHNDFVKTGIPFITAADLINGEVDVVNCHFISKEQSLILKKGFSKTGDVLISHKATIGRTAIVKIIPTDYIILTPQVTYYRIKDKTRLDNQYLKYYFDCPEFQEIFSKWAGGGSTRAYIGITEQLKLPIALPSIEEQKQIASILSSLDDKIELNQKSIKTLEEIGQASFKRWFVDFEFPNEKGEPYKSRGGEMMDSELGEIPKGWKTMKTDDISDFQNGFAFYTIGYSASGLKVVDLLNIDEYGNFKEADRDKYLSLDVANQDRFKKYHLLKDDLVMVMTDMTQSMGILGKCARIRESNKFILNQRICRFRAKNVDTYFLQSYLNSKVINSKLKEVSLGTVQKYFNTSDVKDLNFVIPPKEIMDKFSILVKPIYQKSENLLGEIDSLQTMRDSLLSKLLSGKIRV